MAVKKMSFGIEDLGESIVADGIGVGVSEREDGLNAPSLALLYREGDTSISMLMPFPNAEDLDDVTDTLLALREEFYGKR